jgi:uncharacterized membrane protein YsdA (DUF1294 family)
MASAAKDRTMRNALILAGLAQATVRCFALLMPVLAVFIARRTNVPPAEVLGWSLLGYLSYAVVALPAGMLADRVAARLLLVTAVFGTGVGALAASEAASGRALSFCLAVMGSCAAAAPPAGIALLARTAGDPAQARRWHRAIGRVGWVAMPAAIAALAMRVGWQPSFRVIGYLLCSLAVGTAFVPVVEMAPATVPLSGAERLRRRVDRSDVLLVLAAVSAAIGAWGALLVGPALLAANAALAPFGLTLSVILAISIAARPLIARRAAGNARAYVGLRAGASAALFAGAWLGGVALALAAAAFTALHLAAADDEQRRLAIASAARPATAYGLRAALAGSAAAIAIRIIQLTGPGGLGHPLLAFAGVSFVAVGAAAVMYARPSRRPHAVTGAAVAAPITALAGGAAAGEPAVALATPVAQRSPQ